MIVSTTTGTTQKAEMKWIINNFTLDWPSKKPGEKLDSSIFHAKGDEEVEWQIGFFPYSQKEEDKDYSSLFLYLRKSPPSKLSINAKFSFSLYDENLKDIMKDKLAVDLHIFNNCPSGFGFPKMVKQKEILKCNTFSIICHVEYGNSKKATTASSSDHHLSAFSCGKSTSSLSKDIEKLFNNRSGTDVCFLVAGKQLRAHKAILSARSPVFDAMFNSDMKETADNQVNVLDIEPNIFESLLRFCYTDQVDLLKTDPKNLLVAANRYLLSLLKFQCEDFLSQRVTIENCTEIMELADLHNASNLKDATTKFIRLHRVDVMKSDGWMKLKKSRPDLVIEILENLN